MRRCDSPETLAVLDKLERRLNLTSVVAISISAMLGSGIFVLPGLAAAKTGPSVWLAYVVAGVCVLPAALSQAELATAMPTSGGSYVFLDRAFGPLVGTIAGLGLWLSLLLKAAFALVGFSAYLYVIADIPIEGAALVLLAGITWLNLAGVKGVSRVQVVVVAVSLVGLAGLSVGGTIAIDTARLDHEFSEGGFGFLAAVAFVFVSFAGVTKIAAIAEEVKNPARNLPAGMLLSLGIATTLYAAVALVLIGTIDIGELSGDTSPIHTLATVLSDWKIVSIGAALLGVVTMTSMANAGMLAASRFPFAMSRDDLAPPILRQLHSRYLTPVASILASTGVMVAAILLFEIERIAKLASAFMIMMFIMVNVTVIVLREARAQWYKPAFRTPLYPWVQLFGVISGSVLLVVMGPMVVLAGGAIVVPGAALYFLYGRRRTERTGAIGKLGRRRDLLAVETGSSSSEVGEDAAVVVALFGTERSPEMLVELGQALSEGGAIAVVHLTELPEQVHLDAVSEEDPSVSSVRRRILAMAEAQELDLRFVALSSRDIIRTVHDITRTVDCAWLVMEWRGRSRGAFTITNPLGWLADHLRCNLATFYDHGVRYIRKLLVQVEPGPHDALVLGTADTLAQGNNADITFARFVSPSATPQQRQSAADYLDQVRDVSAAPSEGDLITSDDSYGVLARESVAYDLLITAGRPRASIIQLIRGTGLDNLTERAACSVLRLQAPGTTSHAAFEKYRSTAARDRRFMDYVLEPCTAAKLEEKKKEALFARFAESFAEQLEDVDTQTIIDALWERERTQNTALGDGIALPHATIEAAGTTYLGVFTLESPIDYDAPDGIGVDVFFVTLGTPGDRNEHLVLLGSIAKLVMESDLLGRLRGAESADDIVAAVRDCSNELDM